MRESGGKAPKGNFEDTPCTLAQNTSPEFTPTFEKTSLTIAHKTNLDLMFAVPL